MMLVPERIIDGQRQLLPPVGSVSAFRFWRGGRHPSEVWEDVFVTLELLPVSSRKHIDLWNHNVEFIEQEEQRYRQRVP